MGNDVINVQFAFRLGQVVKLPIYFPLVEQVSYRHKPDLLFRSMKKGHTIKNQSGKQFFIAYPTGAFFDAAPPVTLSSSLSTWRFVPLYIASMMAFL